MVIINMKKKVDLKIKIVKMSGNLNNSENNSI